jgi:hypothetical protein
MSSEKHSVAKQVLAGFGLALIILLMTLPAHCATSAPRHDNGLGVVIEYTNPYIYDFGNIQSGAVGQDTKTDKLLTVIQFQPFRTFELFTEQLAFCGNRAEDFKGMNGPIVVTYKRVSHELIGGVACHELIAVTKITKENQ